MPGCRSWAPPAASLWSQLRKNVCQRWGRRTTAGQPPQSAQGRTAKTQDKFASSAGPAWPLPARAPGLGRLPSS